MLFDIDQAKEFGKPEKTKNDKNAEDQAIIDKSFFTEENEKKGGQKGC